MTAQLGDKSRFSVVVARTWSTQQVTSASRRSSWRLSVAELSGSRQLPKTPARSPHHPHSNTCGTNFSNDDFLAKDLHGVVHSRGLLLHQNDLSKGSFAQQLQIVKITHGLQEEWREMPVTHSKEWMEMEMYM